MKASFVKYRWENEAQTIATFYFEPSGRYRYEAGQYAVISLPHDNPDNRGIERTMTISASPDNPLLSFTMKIYKDGSSFKRALLNLKPSAEITIFESLGDLVLPLDTSIPLVFIAGGVGIASYTGMIQWLTHQSESRHIQLHYLVARDEDIIMQPIFDEYKAFGNLTTSAYAPTTNAPAPRLTAEVILATARPNSLFYLSGTQAMVEELRDDLVRHGILHSSIVFDYFDGYSEL